MLTDNARDIARLAVRTDHISQRDAMIIARAFHDLFVSWEGTPDDPETGEARDRGPAPEEFGIVAHWSNVHDGINVEIDAPDGMPLTVHVNDWRAVNITVGTDQPADGDVVLDPDGSHSVVCACGRCQEWEDANR